MKKHETKSEFKSWLKIIAFVAVFSFVCRHFIFSPIVVKGESMVPTFEERDLLLVSKISEIDRFDEIVFRSKTTDEFYVKRVIGVPGDRIEMKDDVLYVNGQPYKEEYVNHDLAKELQTKATENFSLEELTGEVKVPEGYLFVMGDNRLKSRDSRHFGFIKIDSVLGESKVKLF